MILFGMAICVCSARQVLLPQSVLKQIFLSCGHLVMVWKIVEFTGGRVYLNTCRLPPYTTGRRCRSAEHSRRAATTPA